MDAAFGTAGNSACNLAHLIGGVLVVTDDLANVIGEETADTALDEVGLTEDAEGGWIVIALVLDGIPLLKEHGEVADKVASTLARTHGAHDDAHAFGDLKLLHDTAEALAFFGVVDLARNTKLIRVGHQHEVTACHGDVRCDPWTFVSDRTLGDLNHDFRPLWVDARDVLGGNAVLFLLLFLSFALDFLQSRIEGGRDGIPEVKEGIFIEADVYEHGLKTRLDVFDGAFKDSADDVEVAFTFEVVFLERAFFNEGDTAFEFFRVNNE